jgi:hypothetical protein
MNVYTVHRAALELMVEILETSVNDALPEARRRHPLPGAIPGALLGPLVRDGAREIALSKVFEGQSLRAAPAPNMALHLFTRDELLRIRVRKLSDPEQPVPTPELLGLEMDLPDDYAEESLFGPLPQLALFWAVKGEALYRVVLAAPVGWDDETSLRTWHAAVDIAAPAVRRLPLLRPVPSRPTWTTITVNLTNQDDLDDLILPQDEPDTEEEAPGDAS